MPSRDMGGMRGAGSMARGMGQYGKGGAKPTARSAPTFNDKAKPVKPNRPANRKPVPSNKELVKKGELPASRYQKSISPYQKPTPVKPSAKKGRR